jgi:hypothetical protein
VGRLPFAREKEMRKTKKHQYSDKKRKEKFPHI